MSDRITGAFDALFSGMQEPPTWDQLTVASLDEPRHETDRPSWALVGGVAVVLVLGLIAVVLSRQDPSGPSAGACAEPPETEIQQSSPVEMSVDPHPVLANTEVTLSVSAPAPGAINGAAAAWQCWDGSAWVETHHLYKAWSGGRPETVGTDSDLAVEDIGLILPNAYPILVPDVPPGTYRITDQVFLDSGDSVIGHVLVEVVVEPGPDPNETVVSTSMPGSISTTSTPASTVTSSESAVPASGPLFGDDTGFVLLFDDGIDGVLALDPDTRVASRSVIEGQRAGDPPYRLHRTGDSLIVGWGDVHATSLLSGESRHLGNATIFVPAAESDRLWLINWPGGVGSSGTRTAWQVDETGQEMTEPTLIDADGYPATGIPGGLALETDDGIRLWTVDAGLEPLVLGNANALIAASNDSHIAYCSTPGCTDFEIFGLSSGETVSVSIPEDLEIYPKEARFSPDGSALALPSSRGIMIVDVEIGLTDTILDDTVGNWMVAWSPDGRWLFAALYSYGESANSLRRIDMTTATRTVADAWVPFGGTLSFVVLSPDEASWFLRDQDQPHTACPPVGGYPSGRIGICGFRF